MNADYPYALDAQSLVITRSVLYVPLGKAKVLIRVGNPSNGMALRDLYWASEKDLRFAIRMPRLSIEHCYALMATRRIW